MKSFLLALSLFWASIFGSHTVASPAPQSSAAAVAETQPSAPELATTSTVPAPPPVASNAATNPVPALPNDYVTQDQLTAELSDIRALVHLLTGSTTTAFTNPQIAANGNGAYAGEIAAPVVQLPASLITGLTSSEIPNLSGTYVPVGDFSYATTTDFTSGYSIAAWGDSLTQGVGGGYSYPAQLSNLLGSYIFNGGVPGDTSTEIATRMLAATNMYSWPTIIWAGYNNYNNPSQVEADIASMVAALQSVGNTHYLILSIINGSSEPSGSANYSNIISINNYIAATYPAHYLDVRSYLVSQYNPASSQDVIDYGNDEVPTSLRWDTIHLNTEGYTLLAQYIYQNISMLEPQPSNPPLLTTKNLAYIFQHPAEFSYIDTPMYEEYGQQILFVSTTTGMNNTSMGLGALATATSTVAQANSAFGYEALSLDTTGNANTAIGDSALFANTTGLSNTAVGMTALGANTTGNSNTAIGQQSLLDNTTGADNVAVGTLAMQLNTTGPFSVAVGYSALINNVSATDTVAVGSYSGAGSAGAASQQNVFVGYKAGFGNTTGGNNAVVGFQSGKSIAIGANDAFFGYEAGENSTSSQDAFIGASSGVEDTTGGNNTTVGYQSGANITTGSNNIFIGAEPTFSNANVTTGSNNIGIGYNIEMASSTGSNQLNVGNIIFGSGLTGAGTTIAGNVGVGTTNPYARLSVWGADSASSTLAFNVVNSASTTVLAVFDGGNAQLSGTLTQSSDQRLKTNIQSLDASSSLSLINELNPVTFTWIDPDQGTTPQLGFIAQQVQEIFPNLVATTSATTLTPDGTLGLNYIGLISPIISAIQQLSADITSLENTVADLAQSFTTNTLTFNNQLCAKESSGATICITGDQLAAVLAGDNIAPSSSQGSVSTSSDDEAPQIEINGANPAIVQVGATYSDLGATITGPQPDLNLSIETFLNGSPMNPIVIDTGASATDTIDYVVTDQNGLTATSTRTVIIEAAQVPSIVSGDDASTTATTTAS